MFMITAFQASALLFPLLLKFSANSASAWPVNMRRDVDPTLVPPFGISPGVNPDGTGNCDGTIGGDGKPILVPCSCPPPEDQFLAALNANVAAGQAIHNPDAKLSFPTDTSKQSQLDRMEACIITLQNLFDFGKGCPVAATTYLAQQAAIQNFNGRRSPAPYPVPFPFANPRPAPGSGSGSGPGPEARDEVPKAHRSPISVSVSRARRNENEKRDASDADIARLAPELGHAAGINPDGTGNCDGAVNGADGKPIAVPCTCPPAQDDYISALQSNVHAGEAVHNPSAKITYPIDTSLASQAARVEAAIVTMQNLFDSGKGCPVVSTTLGVQQQDLQAQIASGQQ